ncbi:hypothetical protein [Pseudohongiella acticola]|uniref:hypothetical protein n=1 Tax=Pseudohongiella acticola TaxID=1524254 RepID=UPI0030EBA229
MARNIHDMDEDLSRWQDSYAGLRMVFISIPATISNVIKSGKSKISQGHPCAFSSAEVTPQPERDEFKFQFLSWHYYFQFTSVVKVVSDGYGLVGKVIVMKKSVQATEDEVGAYVDEFYIDSQGGTVGWNAGNRDLTDNFGVEVFLVELLHKELVADARAAEANA